MRAIPDGVDSEIWTLAENAFAHQAASPVDWPFKGLSSITELLASNRILCPGCGEQGTSVTCSQCEQRFCWPCVTHCWDCQKPSCGACSPNHRCGMPRRPRPWDVQAAQTEAISMKNQLMHVEKRKAIELLAAAPLGRPGACAGVGRFLVCPRPEGAQPSARCGSCPWVTISYGVAGFSLAIRGSPRRDAR